MPKIIESRKMTEIEKAQLLEILNVAQHEPSVKEMIDKLRAHWMWEFDQTEELERFMR